jgi:hypothetical protein
MVLIIKPTIIIFANEIQYFRKFEPLILRNLVLNFLIFLILKEALWIHLIRLRIK